MNTNDVTTLRSNHGDDDRWAVVSRVDFNRLVSAARDAGVDVNILATPVTVIDGAVAIDR